MPVTTTPAEQDLIERVLKFANARRIPSTTWVENLFLGSPVVESGAFGRIGQGNLAAYEQDQAELRAWLSAVASDRRIDREKVTEAVNARLGLTVGVRLLLGDGNLRVGYVLSGVQACNALAVALILDTERGLTGRLGQCGAPGCGRFNLTFEGRPQRHCNSEHRLAADRLAAPDRVRRSRERAKKRSRRGE